MLTSRISGTAINFSRHIIRSSSTLATRYLEVEYVRNVPKNICFEKPRTAVLEIYPNTELDMLIGTDTVVSSNKVLSENVTMLLSEEIRKLYLPNIMYIDSNWIRLSGLQAIWIIPALLIDPGMAFLIGTSSWLSFNVSVTRHPHEDCDVEIINAKILK